jgi:hypothetical protein
VNEQAQTMLATLALWAGVALVVVWADARRAGTPTFSGPRWQLVQVPVWIWMAGGAFAGLRLWDGMWMLYGILGPLMVLIVGGVWLQVRHGRAEVGS